MNHYYSKRMGSYVTVPENTVQVEVRYSDHLIENYDLPYCKGWRDVDYEGEARRLFTAAHPVPDTYLRVTM